MRMIPVRRMVSAAARSGVLRSLGILSVIFFVRFAGLSGLFGVGCVVVGSGMLIFVEVCWGLVVSGMLILVEVCWGLVVTGKEVVRRGAFL